MYHLLRKSTRTANDESNISCWRLMTISSWSKYWKTILRTSQGSIRNNQRPKWINELVERSAQEERVRISIGSRYLRPPVIKSTNKQKHVNHDYARGFAYYAHEKEYSWRFFYVHTVSHALARRPIVYR